MKGWQPQNIRIDAMTQQKQNSDSVRKLGFLGVGVFVLFLFGLVFHLEQL